MAGAFQTSRDIFSNPIWSDIPKFRIFFFIVGNAVFAEEGVKIAHIHIKRGQFLRSYRNLSDDLQYIENRKVKKYSVSVISRKIDSLIKEERLKIEDTELGTLFTVVNYNEYQRLENYKKKLGTALEQRWNSDGTELEQSRNNNKNVKNVKNDKKEHIPFKEIVDHLNEMTGKAFSHKTKNTRDMISARWNEGKRLEDFLTVIDYFSNKWQGVTFNNGQPAEKYLQPSTLFNGKFDERVNEAVSNQEPETRKLVPTEQERMEYRLNELDGVMSLGLGYYERINCSEEFHAAEREYEELERKLQSYKN